MSVQEYLSQVAPDKKEAFNKLREIILENLPADLEERYSYKMIGYVVPRSIYPDGYHCSPDLELPFINIAAQKNFIALYHSGIYANEDLKKWFTKEYPKYCKTKLDMGKSCIRFKKVDQIPYDLIAKLIQKMDGKQWLEIYEATIKK